MGKEHKDPIYQHGSKRGYSFIRYAGLYDFKGILKDSKSKLESEKYDIYDKQHDEKISSSGKDMKIVLQGSKEVTEYVKFEMEIKNEQVVWNDVVLTCAGQEVKVPGVKDGAKIR